MAETELNRWVDENWGDLRVKFLTDCIHGEHSFTVRRHVLAADGVTWQHDPDVDGWNTHPTPGDGVRYEAALEDATFDGEYGDAAESVEAAIGAAPGWPCRLET